MKKEVTGILLLIILLSLCGCAQKNNNAHKESEDERRVRILGEYRVKAKELLLPRYSNIRLFPNVLSDREAVSGVIDDVFGRDYDSLMNILQRDPARKEATLGDVILVQILLPHWKDDFPFYYMVTAHLNGWAIAFCIVRGVTDGDQADMVGTIASYCVASHDTLPHRYLTKGEAIELLRKKFSIASSDEAQIKAVMWGKTEFHWGWAVRFNTIVDLKPYYNVDAHANVFWLNPTVYNESWISPRSGEPASRSIADKYQEDGKIGYFDKDVFDPKVLQNIKDFKFKRISSDLPNEEYQRLKQQLIADWEKVGPVLKNLE